MFFQRLIYQGTKNAVSTRHPVLPLPAVRNLTTSQALYFINMAAGVSLLQALPAGQRGWTAVTSPRAHTPFKVASLTTGRPLDEPPFEFSLHRNGTARLEQGRPAGFEIPYPRLRDPSLPKAERHLIRKKSSAPG